MVCKFFSAEKREGGQLTATLFFFFIQNLNMFLKSVTNIHFHYLKWVASLLSRPVCNMSIWDWLRWSVAHDTAGSGACFTHFEISFKNNCLMKVSQLCNPRSITPKNHSDGCNHAFHLYSILIFLIVLLSVCV